MADQKLGVMDISRKMKVDPKTVSRWIAEDGRTPQPRHRWQLSDLLGVEEHVLWPQLARGALKTGYDREILAVYPSHSAVPASVWQRLVGDATKEITLCGTSYDWLWNHVPDLTRILGEKAAAGCKVRAVIGDPEHPAIQADEEATGVPVTLSTRIEQTRHLLAPLRDVVEVRRTAMGFGRAVARGDDQAAMHVWLYGKMGADFPVFHLRRRQDGGIFDQIAVSHVEALWEAARPVEWDERLTRA
jgi:hypothetical protein